MSEADFATQARAHDATDPLRRFRAAFALPADAAGRPLTYLCGHSLGPLPLEARQRVLEELEDWAQLAVTGHHAARRPWIGYAELLRDGLARLAGAYPAETVAMNSLTVNLHLLLASFFRPQGRRRCILMEAGAFPSDRHAIESQLRWHGLSTAEALIELAPPPGVDLLDESAIESVLQERGDEIALVLWPGVQYLTGQAFDLGRIVAAAHRAGARCGFDLAHAIGNLPLHLHDAGADFAVWCGYKYLNGGPGAIGGAFVHARHDRAQLPGLAGWWGHDPATRFRMEPQFVPAAGAAAWQVSNPPILSAAPLLASLRLFDEAGIGALRSKSLAMNRFLRNELTRRFGTALEVLTPAGDASQGCQLSVRLRDGRGAGRRVFDALERHGVVCDWREPDVLRFAAAPLYNSFGDLAAFVAGLEASLRAPG